MPYAKEQLFVNLQIFELCTKAGNSPYNKGGYIASISKDRIVDSYKYKGGSLIILRPIIDKLIFEYNFKDCGKDKHNIRAQALHNLQELFKSLPTVFKLVTPQNVGGQRFYYLNKSYKHNFLLVHLKTKTKVILQIESKKKTGGPFLRCELNPSRLGADGMNMIRLWFEAMFKNEWREITFDSIAKTAKGIKRIDVAVDMLGVDASDLEGNYIYKNKVLKKNKFQNSTGRTETQYFHAPDTDKNLAYWYNKKQQLIDDFKEPVDGGKVSPYGNALYTRFEYRVQETDKPISNLRTLTNHLIKVKFRAIDYERVKSKDFTHTLFLRYALSRTRDKALEMIPPDKKAEYSNTFDKAVIDIWKPEKIWAGWDAELKYLGLYVPAKKKQKKVHPGAKTPG